MIVEVVGFSGAGKSTAIRSAAAKLEVSPQSGKDLPTARRTHLAALASNPALALWCTQNFGWAPRSQLLDLVRRDYRLRLLRKEAGILLLDNSPMHRLGRAILAGARGGERAAALLTEPDVAVLVTVDPKVGLERFRNRPTRHIDHRMTDDEIIVRHAEYKDFVSRAL